MATNGPKRKLEPLRGQKAISSFFAVKSKVGWLLILAQSSCPFTDVFEPVLDIFEGQCQQEGEKERNGASGNETKSSDPQQEQGRSA